MNVVVRPETVADFDGIDAVISAAFGRMDEAHLVRNLRKSGNLLLSLVAETSALVVGHIAFSRIFIETAESQVPAVSLAPVAVRPEFQRKRIGGALIAEALRRLQQQERLVIVLGHPEYYPRFGFRWDLAQPIQQPFNATEEWMALELRPGTLAGLRGRVKYDRAFGLPPEWSFDPSKAIWTT